MRTVEEAAGVRPAARPARLRRTQLRPRLRLRLRLRLCVLGAAYWATWQAGQADCACLLSFINLPWDGLSVVGLGEKGEPRGCLR